LGNERKKKKEKREKIVCRKRLPNELNKIDVCGTVCSSVLRDYIILLMFNLLSILVAESEPKLRRVVRSKDATIDPEEAEVELMGGPTGEAAILENVVLTRASEMEYPESFVDTSDYSKFRELINFDLVISGASDRDHGQIRPSNSRCSRSERAQQITDSILSRRHS